MKKVLVLMLMVSMVGSLMGCADNDAAQKEESQVAVEQTAKQTEETKQEGKKSIEERRQEYLEKHKQELMEKYKITLEDDGFYYNSAVQKLIPVTDEKMKEQVVRVAGNDHDVAEAVLYFGLTKEMHGFYKKLADQEYVDMTSEQGRKLLLISDYDQYKFASEYGIPKEMADKLDTKTYSEWFDAIIESDM